MIVDVVTYNGESGLFDLRYNILKDIVDLFVVIEFDKTFSGKPKEKQFEFKAPNVKSFYVTEDVYEKYRDMAEKSPNTVGADHWKTEFMQKESIKDCLTFLDDNDLVFIGDVDEIWEFNPKSLELTVPNKLKLRVYTYYLNLRSSEEFWGTLVCRYADVKRFCLNHLRTNALKTGYYWGWHFTSMRSMLKKKLEDSYTRETYANDWVMENLEKNIEENKDFLGRSFKYEVDESEWPQYLKDNKEKYLSLCK